MLHGDSAGIKLMGRMNEYARYWGFEMVWNDRGVDIALTCTLAKTKTLY